MNINIKNAIEHFYPNASFEQIYFEAIANALDAGANDISIAISLKGFDEPNTLILSISDNGHGFTNEDFARFTSLLEADNPQHKGLGRLVYLAYFRKLSVTSFYGNTSKRHFVFDKHFQGKSRITSSDPAPSGSTLVFERFEGERIKSYDYLVPASIKASIIRHFLPLLFTRKSQQQPLRIRISLSTETPNISRGFETSVSSLTLDDVPEFKSATFSDTSLDFYETFSIHYDIQHNAGLPKSVATSVCVDNRTVAFELMEPESIPDSHQMTFLFSSNNFFSGWSNTSRQKIQLPNNISEASLKRTLRREIAAIIEQEIPSVKERNERTTETLNSTYPHLTGYLTHDSPGLIIRKDVLETAQRRFFEDQRQILECDELTEFQYNKALTISSRVLMEYILYRAQIIINTAII